MELTEPYHVDYERVIDDLLADMGDEPPPTKENGWFTIDDVADRAQGKTPMQIGMELAAMAKAGKLVKKPYHKKMHYHVKEV